MRLPSMRGDRHATESVTRSLPQIRDFEKVYSRSTWPPDGRTEPPVLAVEMKKEEGVCSGLITALAVVSALGVGGLRIG